MFEKEGFCYKHRNSLIIISLFIIFSIIFFCGLGNYYLMDVDETRYVSMARDMFQTKDYLTLYLNGQYFFEKPPLYFWQECLSFLTFGGKVNEFSARFPVAMLGFILSFIVYFVTSFRINKKFGFIASLITATSLEFVILSRYAILDIVLTFYIGLALLSYFQIYFCKEQNKKYFWWLFYIFSALAVMAKGIPGIVVSFGTVFFVSIITKKFKEIFKPVYLIPGIILFLLIVLPWHVIMLKKYDPLFFNEYIIKHHLHRFFNTENNEIGRKQPFYYYFLVVLWGFIPWIFSMISVLIGKFINIKNENFIRYYNFEKLDNMGKFVVLSVISAIWILLFFSSSSTKLATYILPIYLPLSMITASIWYRFIVNNEYERPVNLSAKIVGCIFTVVGFLAIIVTLFLPKQLQLDIQNVKWLTIISFILFGICSLYFIKIKNKIALFLTYVFFMVVLLGFGMGEFFKVDYTFGQNDLVEFARFAKDNNKELSAFKMNRKYSLIYYKEGKVNYNEEITDLIKEDIEKELAKDNNLVVIKKKHLKKIDGLKYNIVKDGRRYILISK